VAVTVKTIGPGILIPVQEISPVDESIVISEGTLVSAQEDGEFVAPIWNWKTSFRLNPRIELDAEMTGADMMVF
jgi:hypothetical protein